MLIALELGVRWQVARQPIAALIARMIAERMARVRLELLGDVVLGATATSAVWVAALIERLLEFVTAVLPKVRHVILLGCRRAPAGRGPVPHVGAWSP